jgi:hypothetical protein
VLVTSVLAAAGIIVGVAIAASGWLVGSPAPPSVKSDFGSYATQLGFNPRPAKAVRVASDGTYQLFATTNKQGGYCVLVSAPWKRPGPHGEGGDCSSRKQAAVSFWAGLGGVAGHSNGLTTFVIDGRTSERDATTLRFASPDKRNLTVPVGSSGFFIVGFTTRASWCQVGRWNPRVAILDRNGHQLGATTMWIGHSMVCLSKPNPTVTTEHRHRVFTLRATYHDQPQGYIEGARLGDRVICRLADARATLTVPVHGAHTVRPIGHRSRMELQISRTRDGRVWVSCG